MNKKYRKNIIVISSTLLISIFLLGCNTGNVNGVKQQLKTINSSVEDNIIDENIETYENEIEVIEETEEEKTYKEVMALLEEGKDTITKLVNRDNALTYGYKPSDLIAPNVKGTKSRLYVSRVCKESLESMFNNAKEDGFNLYLVSAFRSNDYQSQVYSNSKRVNGFAHADIYVAKPNHSEHQTGLAVDISSKSNSLNLNENFANTDEGKWLEENAHNYGFILRYKKDRVSDTGYNFEPWHFRYVGQEVATYIYDNNLILEDLYNPQL